MNEIIDLIYKLINKTKLELRKEIWSARGMNFNTAIGVKDTTALTFVELSKNGTFDDTTIKEHSDLFLEWQIGVSYKQKDIFNYAGEMYKVLQDHTSQEDWKPDATPSLYKKIGNPTEEYPEWSRPIGSGDAYMIGDKCLFKGGHYTSLIDDNVWSPEEYTLGWNLDY